MRRAGGPDLELVVALAEELDCPVLAEGRYATPEQVRAALTPAPSRCVGTAITDPVALTRGFAGAAAARDFEGRPAGRRGTRPPKGERLGRCSTTSWRSRRGALPPSERVLAERYGVARMTVRTELDRLVAEGAVYRVHGRGTFVAEPRSSSRGPQLLHRGHARPRHGPGLARRGAGRGRGRHALPAALEIAPGTPVVRDPARANGRREPMALEWSFLPADDFPGLEGEPLADRSLLALLRDRYGVA